MKGGAVQGSFLQRDVHISHAVHRYGSCCPHIMHMHSSRFAITRLGTGMGNIVQSSKFKVHLLWYRSAKLHVRAQTVASFAVLIPQLACSGASTVVMRKNSQFGMVLSLVTGSCKNLEKKHTAW